MNSKLTFCLTVSLSWLTANLPGQIITGNLNPTTFALGEVFNAASFEFYSGSPSPARGFYIGTYNSNTTFDTDPATPGIQGNILVAADSIASFRVDVAGADAEIVFGGRNGATLDYLSGTEGGNLSEVYAATGTSTINRAIDRPGSLPNAQMSNVTDRGAMAISTVNGGNPNGKRFAIVFDTAWAAFPTVILKDVTLSFAGAMAGGDTQAMVTWYVSNDGGETAIPTGLSTTVTGATYATYNVDLSTFSALDGIANAVILAEISGLGTRAELRFDNVQVRGTLAVPEPATYATLAGLTVLGYVIYRRRR